MEFRVRTAAFPSVSARTLFRRLLAIAVTSLLGWVGSACAQDQESRLAGPASGPDVFTVGVAKQEAPISHPSWNAGRPFALGDGIQLAGWPVTASSDGEPDGQPLPASTTLTEPLYRPSGSTKNVEAPHPGVQWRPLLRESLLLLGVMHAYRIGTESSTRDSFSNNPVLGYFDSLGSMHGWSDGDGLYENYLGHPMQGAVTGYVWTRNDPRYYHVEFGRNRDYWRSRLRAYAYSWAFSVQFEIGPLSEASVGQIQSACCAYGFVDHVITPNGGLAWMIGEDALDRFLVRRIEDRTTSVTKRIFARIALNPPLAFANVMAFKKPWHRENRPGVHSYAGELYPAPAEPNMGSFEQPLIPEFEISATLPSVMFFQDIYCLGGGGIGAFRISPFWQWTVEVGGCTLGNSLPSNWSGDSLTFSTGPQWTWRSSSRWTPRLAFRIGGQKITESYTDPVLKEFLLSTLPPDKKPKDVYFDYTTPYETTGLMISASGGMDVRLNRALALRLASVDYVHSWLKQLNGRDYSNAVRISTGLVLSVGTW